MMQPFLSSFASPSPLSSPSFSNPSKFSFSSQNEVFLKTPLRAFSSSRIQCINASPSAAEISRTIMELSSTGTLSAVSLNGCCPLGIGSRFVVDSRGTPALRLNEPWKLFAPSGPSSFHVQLEQSRSRVRQCTLLGNLEKLCDGLLLKNFCTKWEKKYGEDVDGSLLYVIEVDKILHLEDLNEDTVWVTSSDYFKALPDPLRNSAEKIVCEMNAKHVEDILQLCHVYVDSKFQVTYARLIWVDRRGFDLYMYSEEGIFAVRIPFPREVSDEKGVKSAVNSMFHLAWEVEKGYVVPDFEKVQFVKKICK